MSKKQPPKQPVNKTEILDSTDAQVKLKFGLGLLIAVFAFLLYAQSIGFNYTYDDEGAIQMNSLVKKGFEGIPELLVTDYWFGYLENMRGPTYRPVPLIMFAVEREILPDNPVINHFGNVLFFALTCWLLFVLLAECFKGKNILLPFMCALLFAAHPIHTEVVDSIKSRDEIMCFLFAILSAFSFLKFSKTNSVGYIIAGVVSYFLALLSKETAIAYLVVIPLVIYFFSNKGVKSLIVASSTLAVFTGLFLFLRYWVFQSLPHTNNLSVINNSLVAAPDFIVREATAFYILLRYLLLLIFPHPLCYDYSFAQIKLQSLTDIAVLLGIAVYAIMFVYAVINLKKKSVLSFAILFYLLTLFPVSNIAFIIGSTMAERFMFMPSAGFCIAVVWLIMKTIKTDTEKNNSLTLNKLIPQNSVLFIIIAVITTLYSFKTFTRSLDWKSNLALFGNDIKIADNSARVHNNYGQALLLDKYPHETDTLRKAAILDTVIIELNKALSIFESSPVCYEFLGYAYMQKQDYKNAAVCYERGVAPGGNQYAAEYKTLGFLQYKIGNFEKAIQYYDSAVIYFPDSASVHNDLGFALAQMKRYNEALAEYNKAISLDARSVNTYTNMGLAYLQMKDFTNALQSFNKAADLDAMNPQAYLNIAIAYHNMGDDATAKTYFIKSQALKK